jgi:hypothetical protein
VFTSFNPPLVRIGWLNYVLDMTGLRYPLDEIARMGDVIYERDILPRMKPDDTGRIVAIDVESGAYAVDRHLLRAAHQVLDSSPGAQLWFRRVGFTYVHRLGYRTPAGPSDEA